jgi:hypothetical protein
MEPQGLKSGNVVIDLRALGRTSGAVAGAIASVATIWIISYSVLYVMIAIVGGGILGYLIGMQISRWLFFVPKGSVVVVKKGKHAIPTTLRASLPPALASTLICSIAIGMLAHSVNIGGLVLLAVFIGIVAGVILAILSSLW